MGSDFPDNSTARSDDSMVVSRTSRTSVWEVVSQLSENSENSVTELF